MVTTAVDGNDTLGEGFEDSLAADLDRVVDEITPDGESPVPCAPPDPQMIDDPNLLDFSPLGVCTPIAGAHRRGISFIQLLKLRHFIESHAAKASKIKAWRESRSDKDCYHSQWGTLPWADRAPPEYSATSGQPLNTTTINLYQVRLARLITVSSVNYPVSSSLY